MQGSKSFFRDEDFLDADEYGVAAAPKTDSDARQGGGKFYDEKINAQRERFSDWLIGKYEKFLPHKQYMKRDPLDTLLYGALVIRGITYSEYFEKAQKISRESASVVGDFLRRIDTAKCYSYKGADKFDEQDKEKAIRACTSYIEKRMPREIPIDDAELIKFFGNHYEKIHAEKFQGKLNFDGSPDAQVDFDSVLAAAQVDGVVDITDAQIDSLADSVKNKFSAKLLAKFFGDASKKVDGRFIVRHEFFNGEFQAEQNLFAQYAHRKTGFENLDEKQIFAPGLYVLGGLPSIGKTTFAWQIADYLAANGESVIYFSYEMSPFELYAKSIAREVYVESGGKIQCPAVNVRRNLYGGNEEVNQKIANFGRTYGGATVFKVAGEKGSDVLDLMRKMSAQINADNERFAKMNIYPNFQQSIFFVDYLQLVAVGSNEIRSSIDEFVRDLKNFQQETHSTVICLSSFNRDNYMSTVGYESYKESGNIEYSADVVLGLQYSQVKNFGEKESLTDKRNKLQQARQASPRKINLVCLKNRFGSVYELDFDYYPAVDYFCEPDKDKKLDSAISTRVIQSSKPR